MIKTTAPLLLLTACLSIPTAKQAGISYEATVAAWPATPTCLNDPTPVGTAKEVLMGSTRTVVIAGGDHPITDAEWATYRPSFGNLKNSDRHLLFNRSCFSRSPDAPPDCQGAACRDVRRLDGHTWVALSRIDAADCVPSPAACNGTAVNPGGLLVVVTEKCHQLRFDGEVIFLDGPRGERAVMHATSDGAPTLDVVLPPGWSLRRETLAEPLVLEPFGGDGQCFYNIIRDSKLQSYHQVKFPGHTYPE